MELSEVALTVVSGVGVFLCGLIASVMNLIRSKKNEQVEKTRHSNFYNAITKVSEVIDLVLNGVQDSLSDEIRKATADGVVTKEELAEMVAVVKERVGLIIAEEVKLEVITNFIDDWDEWLEAKIKSAILEFTSIK